LKNVPNALSLFRIALVPVFVIAYFSVKNEIKYAAALIYALASLTDFLDGYIARKMKVTSRLGKILDPVGDKLMTVAVLACITVDGIIPLFALTVVTVKEVLMGIGGLILHRRTHGDIPPSNILGKISTVAFFVVSVALILFTDIPPGIASLMMSVAVALTLMALGGYILTFIGSVSKTSTKTI
jgi:CDP-diacylglycerol--glycerol-3-phosphate 3-phosphatidyltransferase